MPDKRSFIRTPTLTTLGSQTPKPSCTPRTHSSRSIRKPSSRVRLSSPFARPGFPLEAIELDLKNVPIFAAGSEHSVTDDEAGGSPASAETFIDEKTAHTSILVEFTPGIRGYCTAVAIKAVAQLLDCVQAKVGHMCLRVPFLANIIYNGPPRIFWTLFKKMLLRSLPALPAYPMTRR